MTKTLLSIASSVVLALGALSAGPAAAEFASCVGGTGTDAYDISGKVTPNSGCTILLPFNGAANDVPQPGFVNTEKFFTFEDWKIDGKTDLANSIDLVNISGNAQSGTFTFNATLIEELELDSLMFVFKDGGSTNLVGYLVDFSTLTASGTYASPFVEPPFNFPGTGSRDISHISVYFRADGGTTIIDVPEPASIALVGLALLGLAAASKRRRSR